MDNYSPTSNAAMMDIFFVGISMPRGQIMHHAVKFGYFVINRPQPLLEHTPEYPVRRSSSDGTV